MSGREPTTDDVVALTLRIMPWIRDPHARAAFNNYPDSGKGPLDLETFTGALAAGADAARVSAIPVTPTIPTALTDECALCGRSRASHRGSLCSRFRPSKAVRR